MFCARISGGRSLGGTRSRGFFVGRIGQSQGSRSFITGLSVGESSILRGMGVGFDGVLEAAGIFGATLIGLVALSVELSRMLQVSIVNADEGFGASL